MATQLAPQARSRGSGRSSLSRVRSHRARDAPAMSRPRESATGTSSALSNRDLIAATELSSSVVMMNWPGPRTSSASRTTSSSPPASFRSRWPRACPLIVARTSVASWYLVPREVAQVRVPDRRERLTAGGARIVKRHQRAVGGPSDVEFDVVGSVATASR